MADNEAKARQKMAEGRKKLQGGGGFFSKVFGGGGGAGEAADLFIQVNSSGVQNMLRNSDEEYEEQSSSTEIECSYQGCEYVASNLLEYEQHYAQHSFQCSECGIGFDTAHRLEIHHDERHNPFFEIQIARQPLIAHFRCLHSTCELKFSNSRTRDEHSRIVHFIDGESSRRRKADATNDLCGAMNKMSVSEEESGWTGQNGHGLGIKEKRRQVKKAVRRTQN